MIEAWVLGNGVTIFGDFTDAAGEFADPSTIVLTIRRPDGTETTVDWPPDGGIQHASEGTGHFQHTLLPDAEGIWRYKWVTTSPNSAIEGAFLVYSAFTPGPDSTYTYDLTTAIGKLRLNIDDRDLTQVAASVPLEQRSAIFSDEELQQFLDAERDDVNAASARALIVIASNRQLLVQSRRIGKTDVDYGAVRRDLLAQAKALLDLSRGNLSENAPADGTAEIVYDDFGFRDVIINAQLRELHDH